MFVLTEENFATRPAKSQNLLTEGLDAVWLRKTELTLDHNDEVLQKSEFEYIGRNSLTKGIRKQCICPSMLNENPFLWAYCMAYSFNWNSNSTGSTKPEIFFTLLELENVF